MVGQRKRFHCFSATWPHNSLHSKSYLNSHSQSTETRPREPAERRHLPGHLIEQAFDGHETVPAADVEHQFMQKFPFRPCLTARLDRLHEFLNAALDVGERAALFRV